MTGTDGERKSRKFVLPERFEDDDEIQLHLIQSIKLH